MMAGKAYQWSLSKTLSTETGKVEEETENPFRTGKWGAVMVVTNDGMMKLEVYIRG